MTDNKSTMNGDTQREAALFQAAAQLTPDVRASFLENACAGDAALRRRLEALLAAHEQPEGALAEPAPAARNTLKIDLADAPDKTVGQKVGRYKILEKVGEGGCGVVYVAEQTEPVRRRVALKVIKLGMDTKAVVARFEAERQALAMMDHPNIAKVLDAGTTEVGRPYFVMELVRGIRITDYCDQNQLATRDRIDLFIKICQAIQHAHQKGIIHRDIKPSNILVTLHDGVPVPKVIDFGIAKATEGHLTDATVYTQLHQFIGTPAYMSPEQAEMSGLDIDTRSDIYSLGVLLYELLVGRTPFDAKELMASGIDQMRKTIREKEPLRPSTRFATLKGEDLTTTAKRRSVDTSRLAHLLRGDLDWIVMKCLEKDRTRRYDTANGLAMDLKRHLNNEPVTARPPSSAYRFQKMVRRNKLAFAAAGAITVALVGGLGVSVFSFVKENQAYKRALIARRDADLARENEKQQRQQADAARGQAEGLVSFMIQDLQPSLKDYGRLSLLKQVDEKTVSYYDRLPPELRNAQTELARANALEALAEILHTLGDEDATRKRATEAQALYENLAQAHPEIPEASAGALSLEWKSYAYRQTHTSAELDIFQQENLRRWRELYSKFPDNLRVKDGFGSALWTRASFAAQRFNKPQEALTIALELQGYVRQGLDRRPDSKVLRAAYAGALEVLAIAYQAVGNRDKSVEVSEEATAFFDEALKSDPGNLALLSDAAKAAQNLSYRVSPISQRRSRDAELVARERYRTLTMLDPANADWRYDFAMTHMMECYYLEGAGQLELARQALKKFDSLLEPVGSEANDRQKLMEISCELARLAAMLGDPADAHHQIEIGESRFGTVYDKLPADSFDRIQARIRWLYMKSRVFAEIPDWVNLAGTAKEELSAIESGLQQRPGDSELLLRRAVAQGYLGLALLRQGNAPEAIPLLQQSLKGLQETPAAVAFSEERGIFVDPATRALAEALRTTGNTREARILLETLLDGMEARLVKEPDNWSIKQFLTGDLVQLASMMDPSNREDALRRPALLDRAAGILNSPEAQGRLSASDKALLAKIESLRGAGSRKSGE